MARHLRMEFEGAIYHVTARGNERSDIFSADRDRERFLEKLAENVEQHHVRVYGYVIMTNHYHLLVETPRGNLSAFMQQLNTSYTMYYNVKHQRVGHLFSGRFKAKLVAGDEYLLKLTRYLHLNPVKVKKAAGLEIAGKIKLLREYQWSSYPAYIGETRQAKWVDYGPLSEMVGRYGIEKKEAYRCFVESGLAEDDEDLKEVLARSSKAIGGWKFCRWAESAHRDLREAGKGETDVAMRRIEAGADPEVVFSQVCKGFGVERESLMKRRSLADARLVAAKLLKEVTGMTQRQIAQSLGLRDGSGLGRMLAQAEERIRENRGVRKTHASLKRRLCA